MFFHSSFSVGECQVCCVQFTDLLLFWVQKFKKLSNTSRWLTFRACQHVKYSINLFYVTHFFDELYLDRVNSAFLDKLEGRGRGSENETKGRGIREAEDPCFASESFRDQSSNIPGQQLRLAYLDPDPEQSWSSRTEEAGELRVSAVSHIFFLVWLNAG